LRLTTDGHTASRALSATAELNVMILGEMTHADKRMNPLHLVTIRQTSGFGLIQ